MPEGTERITLYQPGQTRDDSYGQNTPGEAKEYPGIYAMRRDRGGREVLYSDVQAGNWQTIFEIRRYPSIEEIDESWFLRDGRGVVYDIESVAEGQMKFPVTHLVIRAIRRTG